MKLSIIIACYNVADTLPAQLEALARQEWDGEWEIIAVDNRSTDETVSVIERYQKQMPHLLRVSAPDRQGRAHALNVGTKYATGDAFIFCDADDEVAPGWLAAMAKALSEHDFVAGHNEHWKLNDPWLVKCFGTEQGTGIAYDHPYFPTVGGNNMGIRRSLHEAVGGYDEEMLRLQDIDYGWRIYKTGAKIYYAPNALLHFRYPDTLAANFRRTRRFGQYEILLYKKHQPPCIRQLLSWKTFIKAGVTLPLKFLKTVRDKASLGEWLMEVAWRTGQLEGCIKHRFLPL
jgi:glycosyltransferase involved in cell wall biosynthesis